MLFRSAVRSRDGLGEVELAKDDPTWPPFGPGASPAARIGFAVADRKLFDVMMPDIKYCGGFGEMQRISDLTAASGIAIAPHNPSGPVCNVASIHLCAVVPNFLILEYQLAESPLYSDVVGGFEPALLNGCFNVPETPGLGVSLDVDVIRAHPYRPLAANANLDPRLG